MWLLLIMSVVFKKIWDTGYCIIVEDLPERRSDDLINMFFFISCDIEYSFSVTHVYLLFGVIYAMTCMYIYGNKAFWNWN